MLYLYLYICLPTCSSICLPTPSPILPFINLSFFTSHSKSSLSITHVYLFLLTCTNLSHQRLTSSPPVHKQKILSMILFVSSYLKNTYRLRLLLLVLIPSFMEKEGAQWPYWFRYDIKVIYSDQGGKWCCSNMMARNLGLQLWEL